MDALEALFAVISLVEPGGALAAALAGIWHVAWQSGSGGDNDILPWQIPVQIQV